MASPSPSSSDATLSTPAPNAAGLARAFSLTWLSYATYYFGRKGIGVARSAIEEAMGKSALHGVETVYLAMYALGQFVSGGIGDRIGARRLVGFGMLLSAAACVAFGFSHLALLFVVAMAINGLAQSSGWPGNVKAMAEWVPSQRRGALMGVWATCYQVGGIVASVVATAFLASYGWRGAFVGPGLCIAIVGLMVIAWLKPGPLVSPALEERRALGTALEERRALGTALERELESTVKAARRAVLRSVTLWSYGASYFCIKLIRYSLLFWLPYYLETVLHYSRKDAGYFSTSFEIGGIVGTLVLGALSDKMRHIPRSVFAAVSLVGLALALWLYLAVGGLGPAYNFASMALCGALLFGPDALLSGAAVQDAGGPYAAALAAGVVNGLGSIGGILQEAVTRGVSAAWGWNALFYVFLSLALLAAASLLPTFRAKGAFAEAEK